MTGQEPSWPPLDQGTLRERLEMARREHALAATLAYPPPQKSPEEYRDWHRNCANWYAEMIQQCDDINGTADEALGYLNEAVELHRAAQKFHDRHCTYCGDNMDGSIVQCSLALALASGRVVPKAAEVALLLRRKKAEQSEVTE